MRAGLVGEMVPTAEAVQQGHGVRLARPAAQPQEKVTLLD